MIEGLHFVELQKYNDEKVKIEYSFLENYVINAGYDNVDAFLDEYTWDDAVHIEGLFLAHSYKVQSLIVHFDTDTPVEVTVNVYHENTPILNEVEIMQEALGYLEDLQINVDEKGFYKITVSQLKL